MRRLLRRLTLSLASRVAFDTGLDLNALSATTGYVLNGVKAGDALGYAGGGAGDINHDGAPDLVLGAHSADPIDPANPELTLVNAGQVYVLFGGRTT